MLGEDLFDQSLPARILRPFPRHVHALTLVSDPDALLTDEALLATLTSRGFALIAETDPVLLRHRVETLRPFTPDRPLVVVTAGPLNALPYDLWQQGHMVELALHTFFPNLDYPMVRLLSPAARSRLGQVPLPPAPLGPRGTILHVLRHAFAADPVDLREPAALIAWLTDYHRLADPLPPPFAAALLAPLRPLPAYAGWNLDTLVADPAAFTRFVREQWRGYVGSQTDRQLNETPVPYLLGFADDPALQDDLTRLLRGGVLEPVEVAEPSRLPGWTRPGVVSPNEDRRPRRVAELCDLLADQLTPELPEARWPAWQEIAILWAELSVLHDAPDLRFAPSQLAAFARIQTTLDASFATWLRRHDAVLAGKRLPMPHHLFHVPEYLAYRRRQGQTDRVALLVLDGLALRDWRLIGPTWRARHPDWLLDERLLLAQIPTITAVSRQALIAGLRPADFAGTIDHNRAEPRRWAEFWTRQDNPLPADACPYLRLGAGADESLALLGPRVRAACLVDNSIDEIVHGARLGAAAVQASLHIWLDQVSPRLEAVIAGLLAQGFTVYLGSDHGHVAARGIGQPAEGVVVETRGRRARTYRDHHAASRVHDDFSPTEIWGRDGLLPDDLWVVIPQGRDAFAPRGETVVTHGGLTLDEVVVPFVTIGPG